MVSLKQLTQSFNAHQMAYFKNLAELKKDILNLNEKIDDYSRLKTEIDRLDLSMTYLNEKMINLKKPKRSFWDMLTMFKNN